MTEGKRPESMAGFCDVRAGGYDEHVQSVLGRCFSEYYRAVAEGIDQTMEGIAIRDLGCGTGAEQEGGPGAPRPGHRG